MKLTVTRARTPRDLYATGSDLIDVEVCDGVIAAIRPSGGQVAGRVLDADGATILPGLWDAHVHLAHHAMVASAIDVSGTDSAEATVAILEREAARRPGEILLGFGFRAGGWGDPPSASLLDAVTSQPIALISGDAHSFWANTAGLALAGFAGHPSGFLVEHEAFAAQVQLMDAAADHIDEAVRSVSLAAARRGVVGVVDMQMGWTIGAWRRRAATPPPLKVLAAIYPDDLDRAVTSGLRSGDRIAERVWVGPLKIIADGSLHSRTALCTDEYPDPLPHLPHGQANYDQSELERLLGVAAGHGLDVAVHAIGDLAVTRVLDAFAATGARGSVEHAQFVTPANISRFAHLGVAASAQPAHLLDDAGSLDDIWPGAGGQAFPLRSLLDAGATLRFGSDAPVAPLDPWLAMDAAVNRTHHPEQSITPGEAILASVRSSLAVGQPADLILVDAPTEALAEGRFGAVQVMATILDGAITFAN
ncbi:amidohydrolase [Tessaracoccus flavus]|jgi:predicted amidohydrolase YtcJ|uniref:Uncharacterized protein n=1 Tax=Tessaracoccus flavus TaxID=1610493 RepID=A0A1Q2CEA6_9ACTN|nr:amidohydrolase family protein [Tessaracoccus flavus]AQP44385.1 hypothetical protein RPIT_05795 [Tessaracoccus flavus]SDY67855.1 hypothetical protein SAMN05428934_103106 [Tessaracoccus flavus]